MADKERGGAKSTSITEDRTISEEYQRAIAYLTNIEILRHLEKVPFEFYDKIDSAAGTAADVIESSGLKPGWIYEVFNMVAENAGAGVSQATMGYVSGATFMIQTKGSTDNPYHTHEFHHQVFLKETDKLRCEFSNATATDVLKFYVNGVKRRL